MAAKNAGCHGHYSCHAYPTDIYNVRELEGVFVIVD